MEYTLLVSNMKFNVRHIPLIIATTLLVAIIITTCLALHYEHITAIVPYISDTGTIPPESCIFGQFLNIIWIKLSFAMYCKFRQVKDILQKHNMNHKDSLNKYTFIVGLLAAFGVSIVANFQETNCFIVHWIGAVMSFGLGAVYLCMQTSLYLAITPVIGQIMLTKVRIGLSAVAVVTFVIFFIGAMISYTQFVGQSYLHWKPEHGGYKWHMSSTVSEWMCALSITVYLILFRAEFKHFVIHEPAIDTGLVKQNTKKESNAGAAEPEK